MVPQETIEIVQRKYNAIKPELDERARRHWAASEAMVLGHGGITAVHKATGIAISTIRIGLSELQKPINASAEGKKRRIRREGGGRKKIIDSDITLINDLENLIEPHTRGDPESPLRWTCKSTRNLAEELNRKGHNISHVTVSNLLHNLGYSLQSNRKTKDGASHPDRNAQFEYINNSVRKEIAAGESVISVDSKKKELVGDFKNPGREWRPKGEPEEVRVHDFPIKNLGKVTPYGIYELERNHGWVMVGIDHDTAEFAVSSIRKWWQKKGHERYPHIKKLTITADCGGSNGYKNRLWKHELQKFANTTGLAVQVHHLPPGTSKWNKIEHKLFSFISQNWRGRPLLSRTMIINMIASTKTKTGLKVDCVLDTNTYPTGKKVSEEDLKKINIKHDKFHGEWNYTIYPQNE